MAGTVHLPEGPATTVSGIRPSGAQHEIASGRDRAVVVEVGGDLRTLTLGGREILDGYGEWEMAGSGRGQVLQPWPNRLRDGRYDFDGRTYQVPLNEPELGNAIHGLVRWVQWNRADRTADRVTMEHVLYPRPGYPFTLRLSLEYALVDGGLRVRTTTTNVGAEACPFGAGAHPWLRTGTASIDTARLHVPATAAMWSDERCIPNRTGPVAGTELDFRVERPIGDVRIDNAFTGLARDADGIARVSLAAPDGHGVEVWFDRAYPYVMLSTGDVLPDVDRRSIAIEPMSCPPNAFQSGESVIRLEPGATFSGTWGIATR
jgi:aldose 1-epimerase